jgi:arginase
LNLSRKIEVIVVPYDSGKRAYRMGAGPIALVEHGIEQKIRDLGCDVSIHWVESGARDPLASAMDLAVQIAEIVKRCREHEHFPVIVAGNCINTLGAFAGAARAATGLAWLDAHADLNTPATSPSGFLDGMAAATILGWCHRSAFASVLPRWSLDEQNLLLVGGRSFDPAEQQAIASGSIALLAPREASDDAARADQLAIFTEPLRDVYLHLDLDVLDPVECGPANFFNVPDGLSVDTTIHVVRDLASRVPLAGVTVAAYEPALDGAGRVSDAAIRLIGEVVVLAREADGLRT